MGAVLSLPVSIEFRLPAASSFSQSKHRVCLALLSWAVGRAASCEAISLQHGKTAREWDVPFPSMPLCVSSVPPRGSPKFSSLGHSEGIPIIAVHHYCGLYVVVDSDHKLNVSCALFCSPPSSSSTISGFSASWFESCYGDLQNFISTLMPFCALSQVKQGTLT